MLNFHFQKSPLKRGANKALAKGTLTTAITDDHKVRNEPSINNRKLLIQIIAFI